MARDVRDHEPEVATAERDDVVVVAADVARGPEARRELEPFDLGNRRGQERVLHLARDVELVAERVDVGRATRDVARHRRRLDAAAQRQGHDVREAVAERASYPGWPRDLALVQDAAFYLYARGALDFEP